MQMKMDIGDTGFKLMEIRNIPNEVYEVAIGYEGWQSWGLDRSKEAYEAQAKMGRSANGGLEQAIYDYIAVSGEFDQEDGLHRDCNGWIRG